MGEFWLCHDKIRQNAKCLQNVTLINIMAENAHTSGTVYDPATSSPFNQISKIGFDITSVQFSLLFQFVGNFKRVTRDGCLYE